MDIEELRELCLSFKGAEEEIKWDTNLTFMVGKKIFCITGLDEAFRASLKVNEEDFDELVAGDGVTQSAYLAKRKWVSATADCDWSREDWEKHVAESYKLVAKGLTKKLQAELGLI